MTFEIKRMNLPKIGMKTFVSIIRESTINKRTSQRRYKNLQKVHLHWIFLNIHTRESIKIYV